MRTKGIRQAEDESPYTVKTKAATWWKEEHSAAGVAVEKGFELCLGFPRLSPDQIER